MIQQREPVPAAPASAPRYGLVVSSRTPPDTDADGNPIGNRWEMGFSFAPEACAAAFATDRCVPGALDIPDAPDLIDSVPVALWGGDRCSTWQLPRDWADRARRQLVAGGPKQLAHEFWTGDVATAKGYPNRFLADGNAETLTASPASAIDGLACLEQGIADAASGSRGMIHATLAAVTAWDAGGGLRREGSLILTIADTIVVPDAGYPGTGPNGEAASSGSVWAFGTTVVDVRLGDIFTVPDGDPSNVPTISRAGIDPRSNTVEYFAWRAGAATWDGCAQVAVEIDLPHCGVGGS